MVYRVNDRYAPPCARQKPARRGELQALCFPNLRRHTPKYPHFRGRMFVEDTEWDVALWKRETYKHGNIHPFFSINFSYTHARDWGRAQREKREDIEVPKGFPSYNNGWAHPSKWKVTLNNPDYHGSCNVDHTYYRVSMWKRVDEVSRVIAGERTFVEYPAIRIILRPVEHHIMALESKQALPEFGRAAYLADYDSQRRYLLDQRDDPAKHAEEYEYQKQQEQARRRGEYC